jgi:hypothetical protein
MRASVGSNCGVMNRRGPRGGAALEFLSRGTGAAGSEWRRASTADSYGCGEVEAMLVAAGRVQNGVEGGEGGTGGEMGLLKSMYCMMRRMNKTCGREGE